MARPHSRLRPDSLRTGLLALSSLALLGVLAGCSGGSSSSRQAVTVGAWGMESPPTEFTVTSTGATLTMSNSTGVISKPLTTDDQGHFDVPGTFTNLSGGGAPLPKESSSTSDTSTTGDTTFTARYSGTITGSSMTLTITTSGNPVSGPTTYGPYGTSTGGPYTLTYGKVVDVGGPA
jgi:hypothetical protein